MGGELLEVLGVAEQSPPGLGRAEADTGAVRRDDARAHVHGRLVEVARLDAGPRQPVAEEDGPARCEAELREAEIPAVREDEDVRGVVLGD